MEHRKIFNHIFESLNLGTRLDQEFTFKAFDQVMLQLINRFFASKLEPNIKADVVIKYIAEEQLYAIEGLSKDEVKALNQNEAYLNRIVTFSVDKVFFNENLSYSARPLLTPYHPLVSTFNFYLNFILNRFTKLEINDLHQRIILDMLIKAFLMSRGVMNLLIQGFETEAFSTWRTIHEVECVIKIVKERPEVVPMYLRHIEYNKAFRDEIEDKAVQQSLFDELKGYMKSHGLKSKDMKKFIEYGWIYSIKDIDINFPGYKLNFRNGLEYIAGLNDYSSLYEMSSEIAHSSPILIYSNKHYFLEITIICIYETFLRLEEIFYQLVIKQDDTNSASYLKMRSIYLTTLEKMLEKEKFMFEHK